MFRKRMNIKISRNDLSKPELIAGKGGESMTHLFEIVFGLESLCHQSDYAGH